MIGVGIIGYSAGHGCGCKHGNTEGGSGDTIINNITNEYITQVNNNQYVTIEQNIEYFAGDKIETVVNVTETTIVQVITNMAVLNKNDYHITNIDNRQYIVFEENVINNIQNLYTTVYYHNVFIENIGASVNPTPYATIEEAKAGGVKKGELFYLTQNNDAAMYRNVVVYMND